MSKLKLNFKRSSNDQDGPSTSTYEENFDACSPSIPYKRRPKKKPSSWLGQFDCLVSTRKEELCISCFILMKLLIKIGILVPPFHFLYPQLYLSRGTYNPPVKNSVDTLMVVGDAYVFSGFLTPVLTLFFLKPPTTFLTFFCRGEGENAPDRKVTSTGDRTHNHQVISPTRSSLSHPGGALNLNDLSKLCL